MNTGVYLIKNNVNNKIYVGSTSTSFNNRFSSHLRSLIQNKHHSKYLQNAWNKYGKNSFSFIILETCKKNDCIKKEQYYIDTLKPEYNICKIAGSRLGVIQGKQSSEFIAKRLFAIKKADTPERILARKERARLLGNSNKGRKMCEEHKKLAQNAAPKKAIIAINTITNEQINFISQAEASRILCIDKRYISGILNNKQKTAKNWKFKWQT